MGKQFVSKFFDISNPEVEDTLLHGLIDVTDADKVTTAILKYTLGIKKMNFNEVINLPSEKKKNLGTEFLQFLKEKKHEWSMDIDLEAEEDIDFEGKTDMINQIFEEDQLDQSFHNSNLNNDIRIKDNDVSLNNISIEGLNQEEKNEPNLFDFEDNDVFEEAKEEEKQISPARKPDLEKVMKEYFIYDAAKGFASAGTDLFYGANESIQLDERLNDLSSPVAPDRSAAFHEDGDFHSYGPVIEPRHIGGSEYHKVYDRSAYKRLREKTKSLLNDVEDLINNQVETGKISEESASFLKAYSVSPIKRALRGFSNTYMTSRTPLGHGTSSIRPDIVGNTRDGALDWKIEKWHNKYPIHNLAIEGENQLNTLADYWSDKEQNKMTPEKEKLYRENLYAQTIRLINLTNDMERTMLDRNVSQEIIQDGIINKDSDPRIHHSYAPRGMGNYTSSLDAYKAGLENGWHIDDLGVLAAFNVIITDIDAKCKYELEGDKVVEKNPLEYTSDAQRAHHDKMKKLYNKIKKTPLSSRQDRDKMMKSMYSLVLEGKERGYLFESHSVYFGDVYNNVAKRNLLIEQGKEQAYFTENISAASKERVAEMDLELARLNSKKSGFINFGHESDEHKLLRESVEAMRNNKVAVYTSDIESVGKNFDDYVKYFNSVEETIRQSKNYQEQKKKEPGTDGGKDRLKGARNLELLAKNERVELVSLFNRVTKQDYIKEHGKEDGFKPLTLEEIRINLAERAAENAREEMLAFHQLPTQKGEAQNRFMDYAADILVEKLAKSENENIKKAFNNLGINVMKNQIKESSEFKTLMRGYLRNENMSARAIADELRDGSAITRMRNSSQKLEQMMSGKTAKLAETEAKFRQNIMKF